MNSQADDPAGVDESSPNPLKLIGQAYRGFSRIVDTELRDFGFAMGQLPVLVALKRSKALSQAELARRAQVEQSSMAQLLNRMERDGLIERVPDPDDKRSRLISLTAAASRKMPKAKAVLDHHKQQALAGFTPRETTQLMALMQKLTDNIGRMGGDDGAA